MKVNRRDFQLIVAAVMVLAGLTLIGAAFWVPPTGEIHSSVLVAYGETLAFAGAVMGVDYHYRFKNESNRNDHDDSEPRDKRED